MHCDRFELRLQQLLDQRRPLDDDFELVQHADRCADCAELLAATEAMLAGFDGFSLEPVQADLAETVVARMQSSPIDRERRVSWISGLAASLVFLLALVPAIRGWRDRAPSGSQDTVVAVTALDGPTADTADATITPPPVPPATRLPFEAVASARLLSMIDHLAGASESPLESVAAFGLRLEPIAVSLSVALETLRSNLLLGGDPQATPPAADSASFSSAFARSWTA
jgi:hypothetical protein